MSEEEKELNEETKEETSEETTEEPQESPEDSVEESPENEAEEADEDSEEKIEKEDKPKKKEPLEIILVDNDQEALNFFGDVLTQHGYKVKKFDNAVEAEYSLTDKTKLVISDVDLPEMDGIELVRKVKKQPTYIPTILLAANPEKTVLYQAKQLGVKGFLAKPPRQNEILLMIENILHEEAELIDVKYKDEIVDALMDKSKYLPLFVESNITFEIPELIKMVKKNAKFIKDESLIVSEPYYAVDDVKKAGNMAERQPTIKADDPITATFFRALEKFWNDEYSGIVNAKGEKVEKLELKRTLPLAEYILETLTLTEEEILNILHHSKVCTFVMETSKPYGVSEAIELLEILGRSPDYAFFHHESKGQKIGKSQTHIFAVTMLSLLVLINHIKENYPDADKKTIRQAALTLIMGSMFHDYGMLEVDEKAVMTPTFLAKIKKDHAKLGFRTLKKFDNIPGPILAMVRDHHNILLTYQSKFDAFTKILQICNDFDNIARGQGLLLIGNHMEFLKPLPSLLEVCRKMIILSKEHLYPEQDVEYLLRVCGFTSLFEYYKNIEALEKLPCKNIILSPDNIHPVTALCTNPSFPPSFLNEEYCNNSSGSTSHHYDGHYHRRCLGGHQEITKLNATIKHFADKMFEEGMDGVANELEEMAKAEEELTELAGEDTIQEKASDENLDDLNDGGIESSESKLEPEEN